MGYGKWVGGLLGWAFLNPLGAVLGFAIGAMFDKASEQAGVEFDTHNGDQSLSGDVNASLLVLTAAMMKADGKVLKAELDFVKKFYLKQFSEEKAKAYLKALQKILEKDIPLMEVCLQIKRYTSHSVRLQIMHFLFGIADADGSIHANELDVVYKIAGYFQISQKELEGIKAMFVKDVNSDYKILEVEESASNDEIKKAYRKMAVKYHPDKVAHLDEEIQSAAKQKFQRLQQAYDNIKKVRGIK